MWWIRQLVDWVEKRREGNTCSNLILNILGLSVCFDIRFPEMYISLRQKEATILVIPAAFTVATVWFSSFFKEVILGVNPFLGILF